MNCVKLLIQVNRLRMGMLRVTEIQASSIRPAYMFSKSFKGSGRRSRVQATYRMS